MATDVLILQFSTSLELASKGIRILSHSPFSHVDGIIGEGCLGASDPGGVIIRPFNYQEFGIRRQAYISTKLAENVVNLVKTQIGKPFDDTALNCFLDDPLENNLFARRDWREDSKWFCSELWTWALEKAGFFPYSLLVPKNRISPADLLLLLNPWINAREFWQPVSGLTLGGRET